MNKRIWEAFQRGVASQLHPEMLALLGLPFLVALVVWAVIAWYAWDPALEWLRASLFAGDGMLRSIVQWTGSAGEWVARFLGLLVVLLLVIPLMFATAIALIAVIAMPIVTRHLGNGRYRGVARRGSWSVVASLWNAISGLVIFTVGYVACLPLWFIPPFGLIVPWLWWSWLTARLMRFDSLVEHASVPEREGLIARHRGEFLMLGMLVTALNYVPPLFLVTPVLSALVFVHYALARLSESRGS